MRKFLFLAPAFALLFAFPVLAAKRANSRGAKTKPDAVTVELFDAIKSGDLEVRVIAKDAAGGNVLLRNTTKKPLSIKLPEVLAAVPVAAQFGGPGFANPGGNGGLNGLIGQNGPNGGANGGNGAGSNQAIGGGFPGGNFPGGGGQPGGGQNNGMNNGFPGGGFPGGGLFNIDPEKVGKLKLTTVCLEPGQPNPNPHIKYELQPIELVTKSQETIETLRMLVRGEVDQRSAQAAAWHLANGRTWNELATQIGVKHITGKIDLYFQREHLERAQRIVAEAKLRAKEPAGSTNDSLATGK